MEDNLISLNPLNDPTNLNKENFKWNSYFLLGICPNGSLACDNETICVPQKKICDEVKNCVDNADEEECDPITYASVEVLDKHQNRSVETQKNWEQKMLLENETKTIEEMAIQYVINCGKFKIVVNL